MHRATLVCAVSLLALGCPKRKEPERGLEVVFAKEGDVRPVVEKRLAQLGVVARITEDERSLTVRVPDVGGTVNLGELMKLLTLPARLEFCGAADDARWCGQDAGVGVQVEPERDGQGCFLRGVDAAALRAAAEAADAGPVFVGELEPGTLRTFTPEPGCFAPRVLEAEAKADPGLGSQVVNLTFDGPSATKFGDLTRRLLRKPLLIVLDGRVTSAPIVMEPITGGRAMLTFGRDTTGAEATRLARALAGGPLPGTLTLERQGAYGPPSLMK
ncbi:MAG: hypothetical protein JNJ54_32690 [Myxococcaceae bacterium]|nr:hypothetical protein [Myxococcaceae bacterium]